MTNIGLGSESTENKEQQKQLTVPSCDQGATSSEKIGNVC